MTTLRNPLVLGGALLILLGIAGLTVPVFATSKLTDVARIGDVKVQANESTTHIVPQNLSIAVMAVGAVLAGIGLSRARA